MDSLPLKLRFFVLPLMLGLVVGIGFFTFAYAKGYSYLSDRSEGCANCHVMQAQYNGWASGLHRQAARCNDCHTPPTFVGKYATKALNGFNHSWAFTTGRFPEPIRANEWNRGVAERACLHCHADLFLHAVATGHRSEMQCLGCHRHVGH